MPQHSAEFLRGAVESHRNTCNLITSITSAETNHPARQGLMAANNELHNQLDRYRALLAEAEARDAAPDAAAVIAQCKAAMGRVLRNTLAHRDQSFADDCYASAKDGLAAIAAWEEGR